MLQTILTGRRNCATHACTAHVGALLSSHEASSIRMGHVFKGSTGTMKRSGLLSALRIPAPGVHIDVATPPSGRPASSFRHHSESVMNNNSSSAGLIGHESTRFPLEDRAHVLG